MHFTSGMNITMLLMWYQTIQTFRMFFLELKDAEASVLHMEALSHLHYASEAYHTAEISQNFIVRKL